MSGVERLYRGHAVHLHTCFQTGTTQERAPEAVQLCPSTTSPPQTGSEAEAGTLTLWLRRWLEDLVGHLRKLGQEASAAVTVNCPLWPASN